MIDLSKARRKLKNKSLPLPDKDESTMLSFSDNKYTCMSIKESVDFNSTYNDLVVKHDPSSGPTMNLIMGAVDATAYLHFLGKGSDMAGKEIALMFGSYMVSLIRDMNSSLITLYAFIELRKESKDDLIWNESPYAENFSDTCDLIIENKNEVIFLQHASLLRYAETVGNPLSSDDILELLRFSFDTDLVDMLDKRLQIEYK